MNLAKKKLPDTVEVEGSFYSIHTEHYNWFRFAQLLEDKETTFSDFDYLYKNEKPEDRKKGFEALLNFYYEKKELPRPDTESDSTRVLDYTLDSDFIYSAFLECYGIDLIDTPMHWHKVRALINGIHSTKLNDVMSYRSYSGKDKELLKLKRIWALPEKDGYSDKDLEDFNKEFD